VLRHSQAFYFWWPSLMARQIEKEVSESSSKLELGALRRWNLEVVGSLIWLGVAVGC
jgi:hypothetical protein